MPSAARTQVQRATLSCMQPFSVNLRVGVWIVHTGMRLLAPCTRSCAPGVAQMGHVLEPICHVRVDATHVTDQAAQYHWTS